MTSEDESVLTDTSCIDTYHKRELTEFKLKLINSRVQIVLSIAAPHVRECSSSKVSSPQGEGVTDENRSWIATLYFILKCTRISSTVCSHTLTLSRCLFKNILILNIKDISCTTVDTKQLEQIA